MVREDDKWGVRHPNDRSPGDGPIRGIQFLARAEARAKHKEKYKQFFRHMITMITDNAAILGWTGTVATISIGQWNEAIACICGVVTTVYMITKLINLIRNKKD